MIDLYILWYWVRKLMPFAVFAIIMLVLVHLAWHLIKMALGIPPS